MSKYVTMECPAFGVLRVIITDTEILFCAVDIAQMLGYKRPNNAIHDHCQDLRRVDIPTTSGMQTVNFITADEATRFAYECQMPNVGLFRIALRNAIDILTERFFSNEESDDDDEDEEDHSERIRREVEAISAEADAAIDDLEKVAAQVAVMKLCRKLIDWIYRYLEETCDLSFDDEDDEEPEEDQADESDVPGAEATERFMDALLTALYSMTK